ncbi:MAG: molecular chaperone TorD family protein [Pseudomonadota bacterium]
MHAAVAALPEEDRLRAEMYRFLAGLLMRAPDTGALEGIGTLSSDDTEMGRAIGDLAEIARGADARDVSEEYEALFIGLGRGELVPFGSYYLTGFLNEKPLAKLRQTLGRLGIERREDVKEPEDHIGTLCEVMGGLIDGSYGSPADAATQKQVFTDHIAPWAGHFFGDLATAQTARFYAPLGRIGAEFIRIEGQAFDME